MVDDVFGESLRRLRTERGLSVRRLAALVNYSPTYLSEVERGIKPATDDIAARCDAQLDAGGSLLAVARTSRQRSEDVPSSASPATPTPEEVVMAADESARFIFRAGYSLSGEVIGQLESEVVWLAEQYLRRSPYSMFRPLVRLRRDVFDFIDGRPRPEHLRDLYRIAGRLSSILAHLSSDLGHPHGAETHTRTALMCAEMSGDDTHTGYIRWIQAQVMYWQGDYARSAQRARSARENAPDTHGSVLRLASQEARALAALGDEQNASTALRLATEDRDRAVDGEPEPGVFDFTPGKAAYYAAEAHLALATETHARQAIIDAEESLALFEGGRGSSPETITAAGLDLAAAHLACSELEAASEHLDAVLQLPAESRTVPVTQRAMGLSASLAAMPYTDSRHAIELREQIDAFCAYPAVRALPAVPD